jgi:hypothetical protein
VLSLDVQPWQSGSLIGIWQFLVKQIG